MLRTSGSSEESSAVQGPESEAPKVPSPEALSRFAATGWIGRACNPVDASFLVYFRVIFGGCALYWLGKGYWTGLAELHYIQPRFHFSYYGFEWLQPTLGNGIYLLMAMMALCAMFMIVGYCYRLSTTLFALGFTYLFLLDKTTYQNHYYLISLVSWLLAILPAHRLWSVDAWQNPSLRRATAPAWSLWLLRFQIGVPYFYGGIAKISADWLAGEPMRSAIGEKTWYPGIGQLFATEFGVQFFVWGGMLFDLLIVPALLWRRTRFAAFLVSLVFHILNASMWPIGVFPWFMILATVVFFEPDWLRRLLRIPAEPAPANEPAGASPAVVASSLGQRLAATALIGFVLLQVLVPFRHHLYPGDPNWTEETHHFSWHMLLRSKRCGVRLYAHDPHSGRTGTVDLRPYLTAYQANRFGREPRTIHQLARFVAADLRSKGFGDVEIRALALVSLNGRKPQMMIDPDVDLAAEPVTWNQPAWVMPLTEPLRETAWDLPLPEWEEHIELPTHFVMTSNSR